MTIFKAKHFLVLYYSYYPPPPPSHSFFALTKIPFISSPYRVLLILLLLAFSYTARPYLSLAILAMPLSPALSIFLIFSSASRTIAQILSASLPFWHPKL